MKLQQLRGDTRGSAIVEFAIALPVFVLMIFSFIQVGLALWTQIGLQHGVEMAARCATIQPVVNGSPTCNNASSIQNFAAQHSFGLRHPPPTFTWSLQTCGNEVTASVAFALPILHLISYKVGSVTLHAQSCYPI
jgi:hypothetical protein